MNDILDELEAAKPFPTDRRLVSQAYRGRRGARYNGAQAVQLKTEPKSAPLLLDEVDE